MRIGLLQLPSGISGDMMLGALVDSGVPLDVMREAVYAVTGDRVSLESGEVRRGGLRGVRVTVLADGVPVEESGGPAGPAGPAGTAGPAPSAFPPPPRPDPGHTHRPYRDIDRLLERASLDRVVGDSARAVFAALGEAESRRHGVALADVHFHEVGSLDAIADIVGAAAGVHHLRLDRLYHGPVAVGGGTQNAAHGPLPVPAPATLELLADRPCVFDEGAGELTTPTGAALLRVLAEPLAGPLSWTPRRTGYGAGKKDVAGRPNLARLTLGDTGGPPVGVRRSRVAVVEASLDDCTPETAGHLTGVLFAAGALDVTLTPILMKKSRPGFLIRILAPPEEGDATAARLLAQSTTLGARVRIEDRIELPRRVDRVALPEGDVAVKVALVPGGGERPHVEYEDLRRIAEARGVPLDTVRREVERLWEASR